MFNKIKSLIEEWSCEHDWRHMGAAINLGPEKRYWHKEQCVHCAKKQTVLNNINCSCGGRKA